MSSLRRECGEKGVRVDIRVVKADFLKAVREAVV